VLRLDLDPSGAVREVHVVLASAKLAAVAAMP